MPHIEVYERARGRAKRTQWGWRVVAANGRIMATGAEGYNNKSDLWNGIRETSKALGAAIEEGEPADE